MNPNDEVDLSDLQPKHLRVRGPDKKWYFLVSASVDATIKYRNASLKAGVWDTITDEQGKEKLKIKGFNEAATQELVLVCNTLAQSVADAGEELLCDRNNNPVLVPEARVKAWPGEAIAILYEKSLELSPWLRKGDKDADEQEELAPKGSSAGGADSSR